MQRTYSVIIPCFNCEHTIKAALESCLEQKIKPIEVIVIDDFSKTKARDEILFYEKKFLECNINLIIKRNQKNSGVSFSRNIGWSIATGEYICFLDADDIWHDSKLSILDSVLDKNMHIECICHSYSQPNTTSHNEFATIPRENYYLEKLGTMKIIKKNPSQTSCFLLKSSVKERFNENMRYSEDYDLWLRIFLRTPVYYLHGPSLTLLSRPEQTEGGLSANRKKMRLGEIRAYWNFSKRKNHLIFPMLFIYSMIKHVKSEIRYASRKL